MTDVEFNIEQIEISERDFTNEVNLKKDLNIDNFHNKVKLENILKFLPRKILIIDKVYTLALSVGQKYCTITYYSNVDEEYGTKKLTDEERVLDPQNLWKFYKGNLAYVIFHISKLLIQIRAVEIGEDDKLMGNEKMFNAYKSLKKYQIEEITDYEKRLNKIKKG